MNQEAKPRFEPLDVPSVGNYTADSDQSSKLHAGAFSKGPTTRVRFTKSEFCVKGGKPPRERKDHKARRAPPVSQYHGDISCHET